MVKNLVFKALLSISGFLGIALVFLRIVGYEPKDTSPGLWIAGDTVSEQVTDWSFTNEIDEIFVEDLISNLKFNYNDLRDVFISSSFNSRRPSST